MNFKVSERNTDNFNNLYWYITSSLFTIGDYKYSASTSDLNGWLLCDGRPIPIATYPALYNIIGTTFNQVGVPAGYFQLPDYRGSVLGAPGVALRSTNGNATHNLGQFYGEELHTLNVPEMPSHCHTGPTEYAGVHNHGITDPGHSHTYNAPNGSTDAAVSLTTNPAYDSLGTFNTGSTGTNISINNAGSHRHDFTTTFTGGTQPHNNIQPTLYVGNVFIFAKYYDTFNKNILKGNMPIM